VACAWTVTCEPLWRLLVFRLMCEGLAPRVLLGRIVALRPLGGGGGAHHTVASPCVVRADDGEGRSFAGPSTWQLLDNLNYTIFDYAIEMQSRLAPDNVHVVGMQDHVALARAALARAVALDTVADADADAAVGA
jgi:hypothetical protein